MMGLFRDTNTKKAREEHKEVFVYVWSPGAPAYFNGITLEEFERMRQKALIEHKLLYASNGVAINPYSFISAEQDYR